MRLLDLYCGAGGAGMGYHRAGFEVVGVDIKPQKRYPFEFHQADALEYLREHGSEFDVIHASPPCQRYSTATRDHSKHPDLYSQTRKALVEIGKPWIVENVIGAPYHQGVVLCGSMFGLMVGEEWLRRHRNFECSMMMFQPPHNHPRGRPVTITGDSFTSKTREYKHSRQTTFAIACKLMGIDWMVRKELVQAIPPAYTEWIGNRIMQYLEKGIIETW
jgi:DNA (cytosine-5)-methyltransferase 1